MTFNIDPASWTELNRLLDQALDLPVPQRTAWLDSLDATHSAFKPQLRELLACAASVATDDFLQTLPKMEMSHDAESPCDQPGDNIGPYRLIHELGSGGMGAVWLAERTDGMVNRPVALKLPHGAWRRAGLAERMAREREILATLEHPNIARLYDAGLADDGQPYLAIEYVEGKNIDDYCRDRQLDVKARLKLFAQVANAVAYAHAKLVVHRDLKPANILVTADGQVRLLDFGIAKILEDGETKKTKLTELSGRALSLEYASPEQILGCPLSIATDIYSLGVVLFELLAGQRPYKLKRESRGALEDAIVQGEPSKPSEVAEPTARNVLRGDLDSIVLKALKKNPEERYATANALIDDIFRYLDSKPVLAQPDSGWYRLRKFALRRRLLLAASVIVVAAVIAGAGVSMWQARVAIQERKRADEVKEFIASVFREADPTQGKGKILSAVELLRQAERRLHDRGDADPRMRLELLAILGESLFGLQENADSARVVEQAVRLQISAGVADDLLKARLHLALSQAYEYLGRNDEALAELQRLFAALATAGATGRPLFIKAKLHQAALGLVFSDYALAEKAAHEAIDAADATKGLGSYEVAIGLQQLSHVYTLTQRREMAVEPARRAFDVVLALHARNLNHPRVIEAAVYYGQALNAAGEFDAAFVVYRDATLRAEAVFGDESRLFGELLSAAVPLQIEVGDLKAAIVAARRAIDIYLRDGEQGSVAHAGRVRKLGNALLAARTSNAATQRLEEALYLASTAKSTLEVLHARGSVGLSLAYLGRFDAADQMLLQTIDQSGKPAPRAQHLAMRNLGVSLRLQGRYAESLPWLDKSTAAAVQPSHRGDLAHGLVESGLSNLELGDAAAAQSLFVRAETLFDDVQKQYTTPARSDLLVGMARVKMLSRNYTEALLLLEKADAFWRDFDAENRWAGEAALWLGRCYLALGRGAEARLALSRAEKILARSPLPSDTKLLALAAAR